MSASYPAPTLSRDRLMEAPCTKCAAKMVLARIEPAKPGYDLRTFECTKCNNVDQYIVEYEASPWLLVVRGS
jgi:hypothetical protein